MTRVLWSNRLILLSQEKAAVGQIKKSNTLKDKFSSSTLSPYLIPIVLESFDYS